VFLARREKGKRIWVYPMRSSYLRPGVWEFEPMADRQNLVRNGFSGPGISAIAETAAEARELLVGLELLQ
jgi:hypothetical protein